MTAPINKLFINIIIELVEKICSLRPITDSCYSLSSTKPFSLLLTKILTAVKEKCQEYCATVYSRSSVNQMWMLKNFSELQ